MARAHAEGGGSDLGGGFWLMVFGAALAIGLGGLLLFLLLGAAWYAWGGLGALIFLGALMLLAGYLYDRSQARR